MPIRSHHHPSRYASLLGLSLALACGVLGGNGSLLAAHAAVTLDESPVRHAVIRHVLDKLDSVLAPGDTQYVTLDIRHIPGAPFEFPEAQRPEEIQIHAESPLGGSYTERTVVKIRLEGPAGRSREIGVGVRVLVRKPVWVVKNAVPAKQALKPSDFTLETRDVSHQYAYALGADTNLGHYMARINLRPGDVLDSRRVTQPPAVRANQDVRIILTQGNGMTMVVPGKSLADGSIGDTVRVRQTVFQKRLFDAKVIDQNRVQVHI